MPAGLEHGVERGGEVRSAVADQELDVLNLGQFGCLPQRGQAHRIGAVSLFHVTANPGDAFGQIWPLSQLADAVVTADELTLTLSSVLPFWRSHASTRGDTP